MNSATRRTFFKRAIFTVGALITTIAGGSLAAFFIGAVGIRRPGQWTKLCRLDELNSIEPTLFRISRRVEEPREYEEIQGVFAILTDQGARAFYNTCSHMHCSVRWLAWRQQITCPCHGGFYDRWGRLIGGPPPFDLKTVPAEIRGEEVWVYEQES